MDEPLVPSPPAASHGAATPLRTGLSLLWPLLGVLLVFALLLGGAAGTLRWMLLSPSGSLWLLAHAPMVHVEGFKGSLLGDHWQADQVKVSWGSGRKWVLIEKLQANGLRWGWRPHEQAWLGLQVQTLSASKVTLNLGVQNKKPSELAAHIAPPLQIAVARARLPEFEIVGLAPWHELAIDGYTMDPRAGVGYQAEHLAFQAFGLAIEGAAHLGPDAPVPVSAQATLRPLQDGGAPRWAAALNATGPLSRLELSGTLRGVPVAPIAVKGAQAAQAAARSGTAPMVDLKATLQPLQAWMLAALDLRTEALDLSALWPQAPSTQLTGRADLNGGGRGRPLAVTVKLDNARPGRWNEGRLPVKALQLEARGQLAQPERIELTRFELALADGSASAGLWSGSALWQGHELTLDTVLAGITPQRLDGRAAAMTLSGPLALKAHGLPSPDFKAPQAGPRRPALALQWKLGLEGRLDARPQPVQLQLEGRIDSERIEISRAHAQTGKATADLKALLSRAGPSAWKLQTSGQVQDFDPLPWWSGEAGGSWRKGPHRLSGEWQLDTRWPGNPERLPPLTLLAQRLAGDGHLTLRDSLLAGVPVAADIRLAYARSGAPDIGTLQGDLRIGGNQVQFDGRGDPMGNGDGDHWRAELKAEQLATWAPLARLDPVLAEWVPRQGSASATVSADGRWPSLHTEGQASVSQLQAGKLSVARANANWRMDMRGESYAQQPLALKLDAIGLQLGAQRADHIHLDLQGTLAQHRIEISGALPLSPPPIAEQVLGIQAQSGTRVQMRAQGAWRPDGGAGGGRWQALIAQLGVGSWDGSDDDDQPASGWAEARDLKAELRFDRQGQLLSLQAEPGSVRVADTLALHWDAVSVDLQGERPLVQLHADIEAFSFAPLLARAWPGMGWQGDLRLAARVDIQAGEKVDADLVFERKDGDLHAASGDGVQLLGLSEFRLALSAHQGLWTFTPSFKGRSLGEVTGQARLQTTPEQRWPQADAPLSGNVQLRVADIGIWGAWVPPGWRLSGELKTAAALGGTFGAPQYTGEFTGTGLGLRNLLEGVNIIDGQVAIQLSGATAQVEHFTLKGGDGTLGITGGITFGSEPKARLQLQAEHFRLLGRLDRSLSVSGLAGFDFQAEQIKVDGALKVDEGLLDFSGSGAPSLDDDVSVRRTGASEYRVAEPGLAKWLRQFVLAVNLDLGDKLRFKWTGLDTQLRGALRLTNPGGRLAVNGTISTAGGTYIGYGQKMEIERGNVYLGGSLDSARLDILALRPNIDNRVGVQIIGTALAPRIKLFSEPELSDSDKLAWLVLGRAPDGLGRNDTALLQRAAVALLAGEGEAPTDALLKNLGLTDLSLRQGDTDVHETVISLGRQINRRLYLGYERGVNATTGNWQLIYRIAQRFTLRAQSGLDNSLDVIWTWRFQETPADAGTHKVTVKPK